MLNSTYDITVIICAYTEERWPQLLLAVESIQKQSVQARETILVIDHNTALFERVKADIASQDAKVQVVENTRAKKGLSGARNTGLALAQGTLIAFLDDDAIAEDNWLERLAHGCQEDRVLGVGGIVIPLWMVKRPAWFPHEFYWVLGCSYQDQYRTITQVRNPYGGCTCIRREVFDTIGGFCEEIGRVGQHPSGGEETELAIRATQHWPDKVFLCDPEARIHHHISPARAYPNYFLKRCYAEGLSKATITEHVGAQDGLAAERYYAMLTLPRGVARDLTRGIFRFKPDGFLKAGAIIAGLSMTIAGYIVGNITLRTNLNKKTSIVTEPIPEKSLRANKVANR